MDNALLIVKGWLQETPRLYVVYTDTVPLLTLFSGLRLQTGQIEFHDPMVTLCLEVNSDSPLTVEALKVRGV